MSSGHALGPRQALLTPLSPSPPNPHRRPRAGRASRQSRENTEAQRAVPSQGAAPGWETDWGSHTSGSPAKPSRRGGLGPGGIRNPVQPEQCTHPGPPGHEHTAVPILQMGTLRTGAETPAWVRPEGGPWFSGPEPLFRNILPPPVTRAGGRQSWKPQACSQTRKLRVPPMLIRAIRCLFGN